MAHLQSMSRLLQYYFIFLLLLPLALQPVVGFGLSKKSLHFVLSPTLSIFSLPALEDPFLHVLLFSKPSWAFPFVLSLPVLD